MSLCLTHSFEVNPANITMNIIIAKTEVFGLYFSRIQYGMGLWVSQRDVVGSEICRFLKAPQNGHNADQRHSRLLMFKPIESPHVAAFE